MTEPAHAYRAEDRAFLLSFYQRLLWDRLLRVLPRSLRPNTITVVGELCAILSAFTAYGAAQGIRWLYLIGGFFLFVYLTGDNIDGQHARRTGQTSALGEFLDHGLDGLASCAVLLCTAFALRVDGLALVGLVAFGSLGFGSVFWAQYRTGLLVTPRVSAMEGVTGASLFQFALFFLRDPQWLRYTPGHFNVATLLLIALGISYGYATLSPILRARAAHPPMAELLVPLGVAGIAMAAVAAGVDALPAALVVALTVAQMVCRMILLRARAATSTFVSPWHVAPLWPLGLALWGLAPRPLGWLAAAFALALYLYSFVAGARVMRAI